MAEDPNGTPHVPQAVQHVRPGGGRPDLSRVVHAGPVQHVRAGSAAQALPLSPAAREAQEKLRTIHKLAVDRNEDPGKLLARIARLAEDAL